MYYAVKFVVSQLFDASNIRQTASFVLYVENAILSSPVPLSY